MAGNIVKNNMENKNLKKILVIRLGALGDLLLSFAPFSAIRTHHSGAHITLLTRPEYVELMGASPWFNAIKCDGKKYNPLSLWHLRRWILSQNFDYIYDLQTSGRSTRYLKMLYPHHIASNSIWHKSSECHDSVERTKLHTIERQKQQLALSGIFVEGDFDKNWLIKNLDGGKNINGKNFLQKHKIKCPYALLIPGGSAHRPEKQYGAENYGMLAKMIRENNILPIIIGTKLEANIATTITNICPDAIDMTGKTSLFELAFLAKNADFAIGNDTGPMHLISLMDCKSIVLFSNMSDPSLCGQRGKDVQYIKNEVGKKLQNLPIDIIAKTLSMG